MWRKQRRSKAHRFVSVEGSDINPRHRRDGITLRVVSYNVLAQGLARPSHFTHSKHACLRWKARSAATLNLLRKLDADFLCLQEVDEYYSFYKSSMEDNGYSGIYVRRNGGKQDGSAIFYRPNCAEVLLEEHIDYNDLVELVTDECGDPDDLRFRLERDCVGIMVAFRIKEPFHHLVIVANTHLYWNPKFVDVKMAQAKYLLSRLAKFKTMVSETFKCRPSVIVAGDFNSTPESKVYQYIVSGVKSSKTQSGGEEGGGEAEAEAEEEAPIALSSVYGVTRGEPGFTNCVPTFQDTIDYIFFTPSESIKPISVLELPDVVVGFLPNHKHPSDHLPIGAEFHISRRLEYVPRRRISSGDSGPRL